MKTYFPLLDAVRFFAAFWVMNFHYLFALGLSATLSWYRFGNLGVQLFFIISGFVIIQSLQGNTLKEFAKNRFLRLFPLFWILCTITYVFALVMPYVPHIQFNEYVINLTMLADPINELSNNHLGLVDPSYWTLTIELIFYIAISCFTFFYSYKKIRYFLLFWLLISMASFAFHIDQNFYMKLLLVRHASYFIFGGALALIALKQASTVYEKYFDWILLFLSVIYSIYIHPRALPAYAFPNHYDSSIVSILLLIFFIGVGTLVYTSHYLKNKKVIKFLMVLGGITYPLYLIHQKSGNILIGYITTRYHILWSSFAFGFEIIVIFVAYLIYIQDKKLRVWLKNKLWSR
jgi:peptidoglycan/LPS O-acetylase OafA/YrhL